MVKSSRQSFLLGVLFGSFLSSLVLNVFVRQTFDWDWISRVGSNTVGSDDVNILEFNKTTNTISTMEGEMNKTKQEEDNQKLDDEQEEQQPTSACSAIHSFPSSSAMEISKDHLL